MYAEGLCTWRYGTSPKHHDLILNWSRLRRKNPACNVKKAWGKEGGFVVQCCSSASTTSSKEAELSGKYLTCKNKWKVRRMVESVDEMRKVAQVQAEAFHKPMIILNDLFFYFFQAEVLSGLIYRLRNSAPDRYACLVAEASSVDSESLPNEIVGVVDVTVFRDDDVLRHLPPGSDEYLFVSGIAVLSKFRRKKAATALLEACEMQSRLWGFQYLVLRAYEDDFGARKLYTNAGYKIVAEDPLWKTTWIGRKRRLLMIKSINLFG